MKKIISLIILIITVLCLISCQDSEKDKQSYINNVLGDEENEQKETKKQTEKQTQKPTELPTRIIHFETNGGTKIDSIDLNYYEGPMPTTTKEDHTFLGWYLDPSLQTEVTYPFRPDGITTVYAKWIKTKITNKINDSNIKAKIAHKSEITCNISPDGLDLYALQTEGYTIKITITYKVKYKKDYDVLLDIGYMGSPKYESYIKINNSSVIAKEDLGTSTEADERSLTYTAKASSFLNKNVKLEFSTDNIQNIIYFSDIIITYQCYK